MRYFLLFTLISSLTAKDNEKYYNNCFEKLSTRINKESRVDLCKQTNNTINFPTCYLALIDDKLFLNLDNIINICNLSYHQEVLQCIRDLNKYTLKYAPKQQPQQKLPHVKTNQATSTSNNNITSYCIQIKSFQPIKVCIDQVIYEINQPSTSPQIQLIKTPNLLYDIFDFCYISHMIYNNYREIQEGGYINELYVNYTIPVPHQAALNCYKSASELINYNKQPLLTTSQRLSLCHSTHPLLPLAPINCISTVYSIQSSTNQRSIQSRYTSSSSAYVTLLTAVCSQARDESVAECVVASYTGPALGQLDDGVRERLCGGGARGGQVVEHALYALYII